MLYRVSVGDAEDVAGAALADRGAGADDDRRPCVADLHDAPSTALDNVEGITLGPTVAPTAVRSLLLVSDDNFSPAADDAVSSRSRSTVPRVLARVAICCNTAPCGAASGAGIGELLSLADHDRRKASPTALGWRHRGLGSCPGVWRCGRRPGPPGAAQHPDRVDERPGALGVVEVFQIGVDRGTAIRRVPA